MVVRGALIAQAVIVLVGTLGTSDYVTSFQHAIGSIYYFYWWSTRASFVMFGLVVAGLFAKGRPASLRLWLCVVLAILSLLMVWMTELATVSLVYGDYWG
jgi:hypothetical protein